MRIKVKPRAVYFIMVDHPSGPRRVGNAYSTRDEPGVCRMPEERMSTADPICGGCGAPRSAHHFTIIRAEEYLFCDPHTSDEFRDQPDPHDLLAIIEEDHPGVVDAAVKRWRVENGDEEAS